MGLVDFDSQKWIKRIQTEKKHQILKSYVDALFPTLGSWAERLVVVDGFAGRGKYIQRYGAEFNFDGSPLIMLKARLDHKQFKNGKYDHIKEFIFLFIEQDETNFGLLREYRQLSSNNKFIDRIGSQATFIFVDPSGFSLHKLAELCRPGPGHAIELFINFMSEFIFNYGMDPRQDRNMCELFGSNINWWREARDNIVQSGKGMEVLRDLYIEQLKNRARYQYVWPIEMERSDGSLIYYLIYATRHIKGLEHGSRSSAHIPVVLSSLSREPGVLFEHSGTQTTNYRTHPL